MKENWTYRKVKEVCDKASSNIVLNKIENNVGDYALYGASGFVKGVDFFHREEPYIGIVKDGSGVGRVDVYPAKTSLVGTMQYILPKKDCLLKYLCYALQSLKLADFVTGAAIPHIYFRDYGECVIPIPPLSTQSRIVSELDLFQSIIDKQKAQLKELDNLAQAIFYDMFGDPVENEKGWILKTMEDVCLNIVDCPHSTPKKSNRITDYPCIRTSELKEGSIYWDSMQYLEEDEYIIRIARLKPIAGDIVFGREGTIGDAVILPDGYNFSLGQRTMLMRVDGSSISNIFLQRVILSECVKKQIRMVNVSSTVPHVNIKDFKRFEIPVPPLALQQSFAAKIESIEKQKAAISKSLEETQKIFDYTMDKYFGK